MYKSNTELIVIDAKATEPIPTNVVFWSHDKGTAKMIFELQKNHVDQSLATGTKVPILLEFDSATAENGRGKHAYFATIDDAVNGIVSIVLEDNILGYQGRVDGSIYIELPDSRSLDTAGRFIFHIKRSPIDEDVPELEDYYWQGFSEIMKQYNESIAEIKSEAKTTLDSLTADVTTVQNELTNLNTRIDEINQKIDDNDVFTKAESSANVIYQLIGKDRVQMKLSLDFENKSSGSLTENSNVYRFGAFTGNFPSIGAGTELSSSGNWSDYDHVKKIDNDLFMNQTSSNSYSAFHLASYNVLEALKRHLGENFFVSQGAETALEQVAVVKNIVKKLDSNFWGKGAAASGNKLTTKLWVSEYTWGLTNSSGYADVKKISTNVAIPNAVISNDGCVRALAYADPSDAVIPSSVSIDYLNLEITIEISMNEFLESMIAANHVENLATQTEATTATDNTKTMTPLRTKQLLDSKLLNMVYPIGSIYMSVNSATPATLFGGTWERFSKGRVLIGVDESDTVLATSGKQGGSTNPLTAHTHTTRLTTYRVTSGAGSGSVNNLGRATDLGDKMTGEFGSVTSTGDNTDHNNWQPFETVYMWKRTA